MLLQAVQLLLIEPLLELKHSIKSPQSKVNSLLIEPLLELKRTCKCVLSASIVSFNRTTFGIETKFLMAEINGGIAFNRTTFGIETTNLEIS